MYDTKTVHPVLHPCYGRIFLLFNCTEDFQGKTIWNILLKTIMIMFTHDVVHISYKRNTKPSKRVCEMLSQI